VRFAVTPLRRRVAPQDAADVLLAVEGVVVGSWAGRDLAADRLVAVERGLEHALAARERRQLLGELVHARGRDLALHYAGRPATVGAEANAA
jgi:hypothetical protein